MVDAVGETPEPDKFSDMIDQFIVTRLPGSRIALVQPILHHRHKRYMENHDEICKDLDKGIKTIGLDNVTNIDAMSRTSQKFACEEIHFTDDKGHIFVGGILNGAMSFFGVGFVRQDLDKAEGVETMNSKNAEHTILAKYGLSEKSGKKPLDSNDVIEKLEGVEQKDDRLEHRIRTDRCFECLMTAKIREELDTIANGKKEEDRVTITGLTSTFPLLSTAEVK
jgi:hypothetical protein